MKFEKTMYSSWAEHCIKDGKAEKYDKSWVKNGLQHPVRVIYKHNETGELFAKIDGNYHPVRQFSSGGYSF